jgi:hypothetical protein
VLSDPHAQFLIEGSESESVSGGESGEKRREEKRGWNWNEADDAGQSRAKRGRKKGEEEEEEGM